MLYCIVKVKIRALDLDSSDNLSEATLKKFIESYHDQLEGLVLTGMRHVTDTFLNTVIPKLKVS